MDQPIPYGLSQSPNKRPENVADSVLFLVYDDDKDGFLRFINNPLYQKSEWKLCPSLIFRYDTLNIGIAMLNGETKGIVDLEQVLKNGMTPLHLAAIKGAPRLTKYLLERGDHADAPYHYKPLNLKRATPLDLAIQGVSCYHPKPALFLAFTQLCLRRAALEVIKLLVQNTKDNLVVKKTFINIAARGQVLQLAALFLAAPELFVSPQYVSVHGGLFPMNYLSLNCSENKTYIQQHMSLLLEVLSMIGDKLVAYTRLEEITICFSEQHCEKTQMEIDFLLREAVHKKLGVSSRDYNFRFFMPMFPKGYWRVDELSKVPKTWDDMDFGEDGPGPWMFNMLPFVLGYKEIDQDSIYRSLPILETDDADKLNRAIETKLSQMPILKDKYEFAGYKTNIRKGYVGLFAKTSLWSPNVIEGDWSAALISIGANNQALSTGGEYIELNGGWMVNPKEFHDMYPRIFASYKIGDSEWCYSYNSHCTEFVITNQQALVPLTKTSINGGAHIHVHIYIKQDDKTKNWQLSAMIYDKIYKVGYWRSSAVSGLNGKAKTAMWGGKVYRSSNISSNPLPMMGSGTFNNNYKDTAIFRGFRVVDEMYNEKIVYHTQLQAHLTSPSLYKVTDVYDTEEETGLFNYGGPRT